MKWQKLRILLLLSILVCQFTLSAQSSISGKKGLIGLGVSAETGTVFIQSASVQNIKASHPKAFSIEYSHLRVDSLSYGLCRTFLRRGFSLAHADYNNPILGHGTYLSIFLEPIYRIGKRWQFQFRGDAGVSYLSRPFDSIKNPANRNYSTHWMPNVHLGAGIGYRVTKKLTAAVTGNMTHFSNGNFKQPNAGLNVMSLALTMVYYPEGDLLPQYHLRTNKDWKEKDFLVDIGWMFVPRQDYMSRSKVQRHYMMGFFAQIAKQTSQIDAITLGTEAYYNDFTNGPGVPVKNRQPAVLSGIHLGHEFLMGKVIFSQQIGTYITHHPSFYNNLYHRWGLRYKFFKHWAGGFNMKVHGKTADFIDFRFQYTL